MRVRVAAGVLEGWGIGVASSGDGVAVGLAIAPAVGVSVGATVTGAVESTVGVAVGSAGFGSAGPGDPQMASKLTTGGTEVVSPHIQPSTSPGNTWRNAAPMLA